MVAISSITNSLAQLIGSEGAAAPAADAAPSGSASQAVSGAATFVTLSEQAKLAAANRALTDQAVAVSLQAYVAAHHVGHSGTAGQAGADSNFQSLSGSTIQAASVQTFSESSSVTAAYAQIQAEVDASQPAPFQTFTPTKSLSNSVTIDGFTLSLSTNAGTQYYGVGISGNGVQAYNKHFGSSAGIGGTNVAAAGISVGTETVDNNQATEAITITRNVATATGTSVSTPYGSASAGEVDAESSSITFLVNYATGQISVQESDVSVSARAAQATGSAARAYSAFA